MAGWALRQSWLDTLFLHWPVDPAVLRRAVPAGLPVDTHEGRAWLTITPLEVRDARLRHAPSLHPLGTIRHAPWRIGAADVEIGRSGLAEAHGIPLAGAPLTHLADDRDVLFRPPRRARGSG